MTFWEFFKTYLSGPLIGGLIGLFTNYLAVKMLFRPYKPWKIGKLRIPFTPGIIPKRKEALAKAIGNAVGNNLLTTNDLVNNINSNSAIQNVINKIDYEIYQNKSFNDLLLGFTNNDKINNVKELVSNKLSLEINKSLIEMNIGDKICEIEKQAILEKKSSFGFASMFITEDLIDSILGNVSIEINKYIELNGNELINELVSKKINDILNKEVNSITNVITIERINEIISNVLNTIIGNSVKGFIEGIDINKIVEEKINKMTMKELEDLVMMVMKKELNAIIYLGGILGMLIGVINIFI